MGFKIGDKVKVINSYGGGNFEEGDIVTIAQIGFEDEDCYGAIYGAISPYDDRMWFLNEDEIADLTNADKIRSMTDEELADFLAHEIPDDICNWEDLMLKWLKESVKE